MARRSLLRACGLSLARSSSLSRSRLGDWTVSVLRRCRAAPARSHRPGSAGVRRALRGAGACSLAPLRRDHPGEHTGALARLVFEMNAGDAGFSQIDLRLAGANQPAGILAQVRHVADDGDRFGAEAAQKASQFAALTPRR